MSASSPYKNASIYYFSGTGNSLKASNWIANIFRLADIPTQTYNITQSQTKIDNHKKVDLIGFCAPTHGFNFPPVMMHFILRFPRGKGQSTFLVNTRAGMKIGKLFLPGLSGIAQFFYAIVLLIKGYKVVGMRSIDLPSNWISLHPGIKDKVVLSIMNRCKLICEKFASKILTGKKDLKSLYDIIQDVLISPAAIAYYIIGRFVFAKSFYANRLCTKCDKCINDCPIGAIKKIDSRPFWTYRCESCMHCMNNCPTNAIQTAHGFVFAIFYITVAVVMKYGWNVLINAIDSPIINFIYQNGFLKFTIESIVAILFLMVAYRLMHYLLKVPIFERIISYTSFTTYKFWRRFKGNKIQID